MIYKKVHNHLVLNFGEKTENDLFLYMYVSIAYFFFLSESCCCALRQNIFAKTKKFAKPFLPVHRAQVKSFKQEKMVENLATLSFKIKQNKRRRWDRELQVPGGPKSYFKKGTALMLNFNSELLKPPFILHIISK